MSETVAKIVEAIKTPDVSVGDEPLNANAPAAPEVGQTAADLTQTRTTETPCKPVECRAKLEQKSRKQLQALAKAHGIKANLSSSKIIDTLCAH